MDIINKFIDKKMKPIVNRTSKIVNRLRSYGLAILLSYGLFFPSCNYLSIDDYIDNDLAIDTIFSKKRYIEAYMWGAATYLPDEGRIYSDPYTPGPLASDEAFTIYTSTYAGNFQGMAFVQGERDASNLGSLDNWWGWYRIIRQCNTILNRMDEASDWTTSERQRITAYTRFIRAYAYYLLLMNHGPVVLLGDEVVKNNEDIAFYDRPRDLYDDCVEYICSELEEAAQYMPVKVQSILEFGQPTKGAAFGLIARLRLQHASDLYNGGNSARLYFGNWTRKTDGKHYIQQNYDPRRWAVAAAAAKRLIDLKDDVGVKMYQLHTVDKDDKTPALSQTTPDLDYNKMFPDGADGIDPFHSYADMFNGESVMSSNKEFIWARNYSNAANLWFSFPFNSGGWSIVCIPQKIVDAYEMADGRPISSYSAQFPYSETGFTTTQRDLYSDYRLNAGVHNMYVNREARFYASIGFSECFWSMSSTTDVAQKNQTVTYYSESSNGKYMTQSTYYPITGYVLRKYVNPIDAIRGTAARQLSKPYPIIRYAEILLAYAEALNQLGGESFEVDGVSYSRDFSEIKKAFNQVRYRAGLPGLTDADNKQTTVMEKIKHERMVEFLHENQRYFDVRRWGDYEASESVTILGMNTQGGKDVYYQRSVPASSLIARRVVDRKMIFVPIPKVELKRLPSFDQTPGW